MNWTDIEVAKLKGFVAQGLTGHQIARELGTTRNAIIGKCRRLGLSLGEPKREPRKEVPITKARSLDNGGGLAAKILARHGDTPPKDGDGITDIPITDYDVARVKLLDLKFDHCRFPIGDPRDSDFGFCGLERESPLTPYCEHHHQIVRQKRGASIDLLSE